MMIVVVVVVVVPILSNHRVKASLSTISTTHTHTITIYGSEIGAREIFAHRFSHVLEHKKKHVTFQSRSYFLLAITIFINKFFRLKKNGIKGRELNMNCLGVKQN